MATVGSKNILLADDSSFFRIKLSEILEEAGHKVRSAEDGKKAIEEINAIGGGIDLLILDLQMPELDGFGVLEWIKKSGHGGKFPILAMTGEFEATQILQKLRALGASGFMSKDMSPDQIVTRVNKLFGQ